MFKKLFGSLSKPKPPPVAESKTIAYNVPPRMPALNPDMKGVVGKMQLPDSIKQYMTKPPVAEAPGLSESLAEDAASGLAETVSDEAQSEVGKALAAAVDEHGGESAPFLTNLLKDPRFALLSVKFLSFGLSKETAVLWAAESASLGYAIQQQQNATAPAMPAAEENAVNQARLFAEGGSFSAKEADLASKEAGFNTPAGLAAQAASWSAEPPDMELAASDDLIAKMVNSAVLLAAVSTMPEADTGELEQSVELSNALQATAPEPPPLVQENVDEAMPMAMALKPFIDKGLEIAAVA